MSCIKESQIEALQMENADLKRKLAKYEARPKNQLVVDIQMNGIDEVIKKMKELVGICEKVDTLQQRIIKGEKDIMALPAGARVINMGTLQSSIGVNVDDLTRQLEEVIRKNMCSIKRGY